LGKAVFTKYVEDDDPILYLTLKYDHEEEEFALTPEERALIATDGWSQFVRVQPAFYRA